MAAWSEHIAENGSDQLWIQAPLLTVVKKLTGGALATRQTAPHCWAGARCHMLGTSPLAHRSPKFCSILARKGHVIL
jgi:hypothetical protein